MLIPACDKLGLVVGVEFDSEDWEVAEIAEGEGAFLFPLKYLDGVGTVHANGDQLIATRGEGQMQHAVAVGSLEDANGL